MTLPFVKLTGLTSRQIAIVCAIGIVSIIAAFAAAYALRRMNGRAPISTAR